MANAQHQPAARRRKPSEHSRPSSPRRSPAPREERPRSASCRCGRPAAHQGGRRRSEPPWKRPLGLGQRDGAGSSGKRSGTGPRGTVASFTWGRQHLAGARLAIDGGEGREFLQRLLRHGRARPQPAPPAAAPRGGGTARPSASPRLRRTRRAVRRAETCEGAGPGPAPSQLPAAGCTGAEAEPQLPRGAAAILSGSPRAVRAAAAALHWVQGSPRSGTARQFLKKGS